MRLRALLGPVRGLRAALLRLLALSLCLQLCALLAPLYLQWVVDEALVSGERRLVEVLGIGAMLLVLLQAGVAAVRSWQGSVLASVLGFQWQGQVFAAPAAPAAALLRAPPSRRRGVTLRRGAESAARADDAVRGIAARWPAGRRHLRLMLAYSVPLACLALLGMAGYAALRSALLPALRAVNAEQIVHAARAQTHLIETVRGVQTVRLGDRATERRNGWLTHLARQFNAELGMRAWQLLSQCRQPGAVRAGARAGRLVRGAGGARCAPDRGHAVRVPWLQGPVHAAPRGTHRSPVRVARAAAPGRAAGRHPAARTRSRTLPARPAPPVRPMPPARPRRGARARRHRTAQCHLPLRRWRTARPRRAEPADSGRAVAGHHRRIGLRQDHAGQTAAGTAPAGCPARSCSAAGRWRG